jgi:hypothetical protein
MISFLVTCRYIAANTVIPFFMVGLYISSIYVIPFSHIDAEFIFQGKRVFFLLFMLLMACSLHWRKALMSWFTITCGMWALLHIVNYVVHDDQQGDYMQRIAQISFIWLFVNNIAQLKSQNMICLQIRTWFFTKCISAIGFALFLFSKEPEIAQVLGSGFGNGRVNFSIFLSQIVFLILWSAYEPANKIIKGFVWATPIFLLQAMIGSRTGLIVSVLVWIYFAGKAGGLRLALISLLYLILLTSVAGSYSLVGQPTNGDTYIFQGLNELTFRGVNEWGVNELDGSAVNSRFFNWADHILSYRLSILTDGLGSLNSSNILTGLGVSNFKGWAIGRFWDVHNVYIKILGELGVIGFMLLLLASIIPLLDKSSNSTVQAARMLCGIFLVVGMVHPSVLLISVSGTLVYWLCYSLAYRSINNGSRH